MMFITGALEDVAGHLDKLIDVLESLAARGELTFKNIRKAVLQVRNGMIGYWYRPVKPVDCHLMDMGYMRDGEFIVLENFSDMHPFTDPAAIYRCENNRDIDWVDEFGIRFASRQEIYVQLTQVHPYLAITLRFPLLAWLDAIALWLYTRTSIRRCSRALQRTSFRHTLRVLVIIL